MNTNGYEGQPSENTYALSINSLSIFRMFLS